MDPASSAPPESNPLEPFRITSLPDSFYYIPNFITAEEEVSILSKIPPSRWTPLSHRRLQSHPSTLTSTNTLLASPLPAWLTSPILPRFAQLGVFRSTKHSAPNHVLVNEYKPGEGIMMHEDGGAYEGVVGTVSLGGGICLDVRGKDRKEGGEDGKDGKHVLSTRIFQEPRSLLVTTGAAYESTLHGISGVHADTDLNADTVANWGLLSAETREVIEGDGGVSERGTRVSLTYRDVRRVSGVANRILGARR